MFMNPPVRQAAERRVVFRGPRGEIIHFSTCPTHSMFFTRFAKGLLERMGRETKSDLALDHNILSFIFKNFEEELNNKTTSQEHLRWVVLLVSYLVIVFLGSLRVNEGYMVEIGGLIQHIEDGKAENEDHPHIVIPLLGRFKNESGKRWFLILCAAVTVSGFKPRV